MIASLEKAWKQSLESLREGQYDCWPSHEFIRTGHPNTKTCYQPTPTYGKPIWNGEPSSIRLLVNCDCGLGDTICFWRYVYKAMLCVNCIVRCNNSFQRIFDLDTANILVVDKDGPLPEFDEIIHIMALPKLFGIYSNIGVPYLRPNQKFVANNIHHLLSKMSFTRIGFCWTGNPFNPRDHYRSIPDKDCEWLFKSNELPIISLVKHKVAPLSRFLDFRSCMGDWNDTAYLLKSLDFVVSVDTAIAHLAGAMGVFTYLILGDEAVDWRWGLAGSTTIWYDWVKLVRKNGRDWQEVLTEITDEIKSRA
jgi:hypothetical protein